MTDFIYAIDPNFYIPTAVSIRSLRSYESGKISVYHSGLTNVQQELLTLAAHDENIVFNYVPQRKVKLKRTHLSSGAFLRYQAFEQVKSRQVLYLDGDTLVMRPLNLTSVPKPKIAALVPHMNVTRDIQRLNLKTSYYFNSGVMLVNTHEWQRKQYTEQLLKNI